MKTLFISDLHLQAQRPDITQAFVDFCTKKLTDCEALYILGDLVDAWLGDDDDSETAVSLKSVLRSISDRGIALHLMVGNRDFLMGQAFAADCGATLLADPSVIDLYGEAVLLMHGDSLCTKDMEYMQFRAQIRNPLMQQQLLSKPLQERRMIAQQLRQQSQAANATKACDIMDVTEQEVVDAMNTHKVALMIHGHTHRPAIHSHQLADSAGKRYVLGDWDKNFWYIEASSDNNTLELALIEQSLA